MDAFNGVSPVRCINMDDSGLAMKIDEDILTYVKAKLSNQSIVEQYGRDQKAEGLFQWAAVARNYIAHPPTGLLVTPFAVC